MPKQPYSAKNSSKSITDIPIQSGFLKGVRLKSPQHSTTHPMGSREKLALFNMLTPYLENATVIDLYAGSGALGFEALSLGAKAVVFVEKNCHAAQTIRTNLRAVQEAIGKNIATNRLPLDYAYACEIKEIRAERFCRDEKYAKQFDLTLADPPYDNFIVAELANCQEILRSKGILALSYPVTQFATAPQISGFKLLKSRQYAAAGIAIYQKD